MSITDNYYRQNGAGWKSDPEPVRQMGRPSVQHEPADDPAVEHLTAVFADMWEVAN